MSEDNDDDMWGSHRPVLRAIAKFMPIRSVIEFGGGLYSTSMFLNRSVFADLESLVTFEWNDEWAGKIRTDDPRHRIIMADPRQFIEESANMKADFVFIDGPESRNPLMAHALTIAPLFAIHDRQPSEVTGFKYVCGFNGKIQTVVASDTIDLSGLNL